MRTAILLAAACALTGCTAAGGNARGTAYELAIDPTSTPDEIAADLAAADAWHALIPDLAITPIVEACESGGDGRICLQRKSLTWMAGNHYGPEGHTWAQGDGAMIYVVPIGTVETGAAGEALTLGAEGYAHLVTHEIGHALGLKHDREGTVMCAIASCASPAPTSQDAVRFWQAR